MLPMGLISGDADKQAETCLDTAGGCRVVAETVDKKDGFFGEIEDHEFPHPGRTPRKGHPAQGGYD
jgi:hypothetical protein